VPPHRRTWRFDVEDEDPQVNVLEIGGSTSEDDAPEPTWTAPVDEHLVVAVVAATADGDWAIVSASGEVDIASAPALSDAISTVSGPGALVILDLTGVSFMDSTGLSVLIRGFKALRDVGGELRIVVTGARIPRLLAVTRLDRIFLTYPTVALAQERPASSAN
jgi:anti-sigma B factor antagonist